MNRVQESEALGDLPSEDIRSPNHHGSQCRELTMGIFFYVFHYPFVALDNLFKTALEIQKKGVERSRRSSQTVIVNLSRHRITALKMLEGF